jgi:hypothetical protein
VTEPYSEVKICEVEPETPPSVLAEQPARASAATNPAMVSEERRAILKTSECKA